jgi:hypothetical protein
MPSERFGGGNGAAGRGGRNGRGRGATGGNGHGPASPAAAAAAAATDEARANGRGAAGQETGPPKVEVLVPGSHPTSDGRTDVSNDAFADTVLGALPEDLLYRPAAGGAVKGCPVGVLAGTPGCREFDPVDATDFRLFVDERCYLARWIRTERGNPLRIYVNCNEGLAKLVLGRAKRSGRARPLSRVVHYPAYGPDFELLRPGWADGTFYDPPPELAGLVPETDREVIVQALEDLVVDFPFMSEPTGRRTRDGREEPDEGEANRQNFYGLLLTPIVRTAIDGNVPLHLVNAPLERTGKSKLVEEVLGGVLLGSPTPAAQQVTDPEEFKKHVTGYLLQGRTLVHMDNVNDAMNLGNLASLLTAAYFEGRLLGTNSVVSLRNTLIWVASGNNVEGSAEVIKRVVPVHLQPKDDHPEDRPAEDFRHADLRPYIRSVRRQVLAVLLGMVEVWKAAGRPLPEGTTPLGGFEEWARVVGGILQANGFRRWMANARAWRKVADLAGGELEGLVDLWAQRFGDHPVKPKHLLRLAAEGELFEDLRRSRDGGLNRLGRLLKKSNNRPVGGHVVKLLTSGNNTSYYLQGAQHKEFVDLGEEADAPAGAGFF